MPNLPTRARRLFDFFSYTPLQIVRSIVGSPTASQSLAEGIAGELPAPSIPDGILYLTSTGIEAGGLGWSMQLDPVLSAVPMPEVSAAAIVRILGFVFIAPDAIGNDIALSGLNDGWTIAANKWGAVRLLFMMTSSDFAPHFAAVVASQTQSYDTEAEAFAAVPAVPFACVNAGIFVIQATGAGFTQGLDNLTVGEGIAALTIHQPEVL